MSVRLAPGATLPALLVWLLQGAPAAADDLPHVMAEAYASSPELRSAREKLRSVNEGRPQALGSWLPTVTIQADSTNENIRQPVNGAREINYRYANSGAQVSVSQPITQGGSEFARLSQAENSIRQQRAIMVSTEQTALLNAVEAYVSIVSAEKIIESRRRDLDDLRRLRQAAERQLALGDRTRADTAQADARVAAAQADLAQAGADLDDARALFRQSTGRAAGKLSVAKPPEIPFSDAEAVEEAASRSSPTVLAAAFGLNAAEDLVDYRTRRLLPSLSLNGSFRRERNTYTDLMGSNGVGSTATVTVTLSVPIYQAGVAESQVRAAKYDAKTARFDLDTARRKAIKEALSAWNLFRSTATQSAALNTRVKAAATAVEQTRREEEMGLGTFVDLLNAQRELIEAQVAQAQIDAKRVLAGYQVLAGVGGLTARSLNLPVPPMDIEGDYQRTKWRLFGVSVD